MEQKTAFIKSLRKAITSDFGVGLTQIGKDIVTGGKNKAVGAWTAAKSAPKNVAIHAKANNPFSTISDYGARVKWHGSYGQHTPPPRPDFVDMGTKDAIKNLGSKLNRGASAINNVVGAASGLATAGVIAKGLVTARKAVKTTSHPGILGKVQNAGRHLQRGAAPGGIKQRVGKYIEQNPLSSSIFGTSAVGLGGSLLFDSKSRRTS